MSKPTWPVRDLTHYPTPKRQGRQPIIAVDIETDNLGGQFIIGGYSREGEDTVTYFHSIGEWTRALLSSKNLGHIWYAHNGGEYDYKYLIDDIRSRLPEYPGMSLHPLMADNKVVGLIIRYRKHKIELRDSMRLLLCGLEKASLILAPMWHKQDIGLKLGTVFNPNNAVHMEYLYFDIMALKHSMIAFRGIVYDNFAVYPSWTIASTAMKAWRHTIPPKSRYFRIPKCCEQICREAYKGGIVFLRTTKKITDVLTVDVNSMYPFVMREFGVPYNDAMLVDRYYDDRPGFYRVVAHVPDSVPFYFVGERTPTGTAYPTGTFTTVLTSQEMCRAAQHGVTFEVLEGVTFAQMIYPFQEFVDICERLRTQYKDTAIEFVVKILQNALYGKFGTKETCEKYVFMEELPEDDMNWNEVVDPQSGELVEHLYMREEAMHAPYMHVEWAAWITAEARGHLARIAAVVGYDAIYYGDTDSLVADRHAVYAAIECGVLDISASYGAAKIEREWQEFCALAPKSYYGTTYAGKRVVRAKGIHKDHASYEDMEQTACGEKRKVSYRSVNGTLQTWKRGAAYSVQRSRTYGTIAHSANWQEQPNGDVCPPHREMIAAPN